MIQRKNYGYDVFFMQYSKKWRFEANVTKCAVVVFRMKRLMMVNDTRETLLCHILIIITIHE